MTDDRLRGESFDHVLMELTPEALDAWIAEYVLECILSTSTLDGRSRCVNVDHIGPDHFKGLSTTGDGMFMVLEAMRKQSWDAELGVTTVNCYAAFTHMDEAIAPVSAVAPELPLAVALAAQAALIAEAKGEQ